MKPTKKFPRLLVAVAATLFVAVLVQLRRAGPDGPVLSAAERGTLRDAPGDDSDSLGGFDTGQLRARLSQAQQGNPAPAPGAPAAAAATGVAAAAGGAADADCDTPVPPLPASSSALNKVNGRSYPSVFMAWQPASNTGSAHHDMIWSSPGYFGLGCYNADADGKPVKQAFTGLCTLYLPALSHNDNVVRLAEIRWHDGWFGSPGRQYLPANSPLWLNGGPSNPANLTPTTMTLPAYRLDYKNACFKKQAALQCQAAVKAGLDGCMFDWWSSPDSDQVDMLKKVRAAIGDALIIVNANGHVPSDLSDVNGAFTEGFGTSFFSPGGTGKNGDSIPYPKPEAWQYLIQDLKKLKGAREPQINAIEGWGDESDSRYMRALTTLVLVYSDAYVLYSRSNAYQGNPDHSHVWDAFWTQDLGQPIEQDPPDPARAIPGGAVYRRFSKGIAVYNPTADLVTVPAALLSGLHRSHRLNAPLVPGVDAQVPPGDGDIFVQ
jgi:hypothetical protein